MSDHAAPEDFEPDEIDEIDGGDPTAAVAESGRPVIAFDAGPLYGHRTGVGTAVAGMLGALSEREDVELMPYIVSGRSAAMSGHRKLPVPGIVASHVWSRSDHPRADRWLDGANVVHGTNYVAPPTQLPTVVSVYDCWFLRHPELASALVSRAGANLRRAVARGAWVHASSHATEAAVREVLQTERVMTVPLGPPDPFSSIDAPPAHLNELRGQRFVLAIGSEERRKGLPLLVAAYAELASDHPDLRLVLAGADGDDSAAVTDAIAAVPDPSRVARLGPVDDQAKVWLMKQASVLAYPSIDEGFGFPVLEAQMAGTPIVATSVGSIPEVAGDGAVLVDGVERSTSAFAAAIADVLSGGRRLELIESGYRNVQRFDWATTAAGLTDLYERAIESAS
jgi:glycosyltransferase involved in cell wall biosynthesis